jgi:adenosylmethionine-8-amino-7-oxononanoate aminotransferase
VSKVFHRNLRSSLPLAVSGHGITLTDEHGKTYIDASGGAAVSCLGHAHPDVLAAMHMQIDKLAYAHTSFFSTEVAEELATTLIASAPHGLNTPESKAYFVSGGSEAMEAALKMARQYFVDRGEPERTHFIARRQSYHGNTLGALAIGGNSWRRAPFAPILIDVTHISPCYAYRERGENESDATYVARLEQELDAAMTARGEGSVIAFVAETVGGATAGVLTPVPGYFKAMREVCDRHGALLILDEVMCGMGRTGALHACTQEGVSPDLMAIAKGLGGGYQPIGAVLASGAIVDVLRSKTGYFQHGHTYLGHAVACAAALAVQKVLLRDGLIQKVASDGVWFGEALHAAFDTHPHVGDIRGRGFFWGLEFVADRKSKAPFAAEKQLHAKLKRAAMTQGLMVYPMGGTVDGQSGDHVLLAPPFIATRDELGTIIARLHAALNLALTEIQ